MLAPIIPEYWPISHFESWFSLDPDVTELLYPAGISEQSVAPEKQKFNMRIIDASHITLLIFIYSQYF